MECKKCSKYELSFKHTYYAPEDFLWGKKNSPIWIVALNPKERPGYSTYTVGELERYFDTENKTLPFFKDYAKVSPKLFELLGRDNGAIHTDIVKCFSKKFPPEGCSGKEVKEIIGNCKPYFEQQLGKWIPKLVVCNGRAVCDVVKGIIKPIDESETSYYGTYNGANIVVILSGFIGRIDDYAKRRLGLEIEKLIEKLRIG